MIREQGHNNNQLFETKFDSEEGYFRDSRRNIVDKNTGDIWDPEATKIIGKVDEQENKLFLLQEKFPGYSQEDLTLFLELKKQFPTFGDTRLDLLLQQKKLHPKYKEKRQVGEVNKQAKKLRRLGNRIK